MVISLKKRVVNFCKMQTSKSIGNLKSSYVDTRYREVSKSFTKGKSASKPGRNSTQLNQNLPSTRTNLAIPLRSGKRTDRRRSKLNFSKCSSGNSSIVRDSAISHYTNALNLGESTCLSIEDSVVVQTPQKRPATAVCPSVIKTPSVSPPKNPGTAACDPSISADDICSQLRSALAAKNKKVASLESALEQKEELRTALLRSEEGREKLVQTIDELRNNFRERGEQNEHLLEEFSTDNAALRQ